MDEYVSKETLLKAVEKLDRLDKETNTKYEYNKQGYILLIENAPTADVEEVRHGKWIDDMFNDGHKICSLCENYPVTDVDGNPIGVLKGYQPHHCPNCGAKMDGGKE